MSIHTGKYVSYLRVSTKKQGVDGNGIEAQRMTINRHLNGGDWQLIAEYAEQISGKTAMRNRPQLRAAIKFALVNDATLIFAKMDRALRKLDVLIEILNSGVRTVFCDVPEMGKPSMSRFLLQQFAIVAELDGAQISERTKEGLAAAKAKGKVLGSPKPQAGAAAARRKRTTVSNDFALAVGPRIKKARKAGASSYREIAEALRNLGIQTARGNLNWQQSSVRYVENKYDKLMCT